MKSRRVDLPWSTCPKTATIGGRSTFCAVLVICGKKCHRAIFRSILLLCFDSRNAFIWTTLRQRRYIRKRRAHSVMRRRYMRTPARYTAKVSLRNACSPRRAKRSRTDTHWIVSSIEHSSVLECFAEIERMGGTVSHVEQDAKGIVRAESVAAL